MLVWDSSVKINIDLTSEMALSDPLLRDSHDYLRIQAFSVCVLVHTVALDSVHLTELLQWAECQQCPWNTWRCTVTPVLLWRAELWNIASWLPWLSPPGISRLLYTVELLVEKTPNLLLLPEAVNGKQSRGWSSPFLPWAFPGEIFWEWL